MDSPVSVILGSSKQAPSQQTMWSTARELWRAPHCTSCQQCKEAMRAVVQRCGDNKLDWITPLTRACIDGRTECVYELLKVKPPEAAPSCTGDQSDGECHKVEAPWRRQWMIDFADSESHVRHTARTQQVCYSILLLTHVALSWTDGASCGVCFRLRGLREPTHPGRCHAGHDRRRGRHPSGWCSHGALRLWEGLCRPVGCCGRQGDVTGDGAGLGHTADTQLPGRGARERHSLEIVKLHEQCVDDALGVGELVARDGVGFARGGEVPAGLMAKINRMTTWSTRRPGSSWTGLREERRTAQCGLMRRARGHTSRLSVWTAQGY